MLLTIIVIQDLLTRSIAKWIVFSLAILLISRSLITTGLETLGINISLNLIFIFFQLLCISIYFSLRKRKVVNIVDHYLGLGDIAFLLIICALFSPLNLLMYYIGSTFFALFVYGIYIVVKEKSDKSIPLAGIMSIVLVMLFVLKYTFIDIDFQSDEKVMSMLEPWMISIL